MLAGVVAVADVVDVQETRAVTVDLMEGLLDKLEAFVAELTADRHEELIDVECAVTIGVKGSKECRDVLFRDTGLEITTRLRKLLL